MLECLFIGDVESTYTNTKELTVDEFCFSKNNCTLKGLEKSAPHGTSLKPIDWLDDKLLGHWILFSQPSEK